MGRLLLLCGRPIGQPRAVSGGQPVCRAGSGRGRLAFVAGSSTKSGSTRHRLAKDREQRSESVPKVSEVECLQRDGVDASAAENSACRGEHAIIVHAALMGSLLATTTIVVYFVFCHVEVAHGSWRLDSTMQTIRDTIYSFKARWFDPHAQLNRQFHVRYFADTHNVEIFDTKSNKLFLKKSELPSSLTPRDFFLGAKVLLYGRHFELLEYLDPFTAEKLGRQQQKAVLVVQHADLVASAFGALLDALQRQQFALSALKMLRVRRTDAEKFLEFHRSATDFGDRVEHLSGAPVVAMELVAEQCLDKLKQFVPTLLARFGVDALALDYSPTVLEAQRYREFFFETPHGATAQLKHCTCCVILPHILKEGLAGEVIEAIQQGPDVRITAMELFNLDRTTASEFLEVYEGVVPHFNETVDHFTTGPCIALELIGKHPESVVAKFREHMGPWDVEMAKELKPNTVRARFGHDRVRNAVHCTDLAEDGVLECEYFFDILSKRQVKSS